MHDAQNKFITINIIGPRGSGKTTIAEIIKKGLKKSGKNIEVTEIQESKKWDYGNS